MKSGIVFDLDETLIDRRGTLEDYANRLWEDFNIGVAASQAQFLASFLALDADGCTPQADLFARLAEAFPRPPLDPLEIAHHFSEFAWTRPRLASGVACGLAKLRAAGIPLGIITNGGAESQMRKLRGSGLDQLVDHYLISSQFGAAKPDRSIFMAMCSTLRIEAPSSWFIGDHPVFDVWGANRVGFRTIWLERRVPWPEEHNRCYTHLAPDIASALQLIDLDA